MNKPSRSFAKPLRDLVGKVVGETFTRQGFASAELVTRWAEIVGAEIAAHSEPIKIQWPRHRVPLRRGSALGVEPTGTLVLRVEGPAAIEIQHLADVDLRTGQSLSRLARRRADRAAPGAAAARPRAAAPRTADPAAAAAHRRQHAGDRRRRAEAGAGPPRRGRETAVTRHGTGA